MNLIRQTIIVDNIQRNGQSFSVDGAVSFTINNIGKNNAYIKYTGRSKLMSIAKGTAREFPGVSGFAYAGEMTVEFIGSNQGLLEVVKSVVVKTEHTS